MSQLAPHPQSNAQAPADDDVPGTQTPALDQLPVWKPLLVAGAVALGFEVFASVGFREEARPLAWGSAASGVPLAYWFVSAARRGHSVGAVMGEGLSHRHLPLVVAASLAMIAFSVGWEALWALLGWATPASAFEQTTSPASLWISAFVTAIVAPCGEEILFRGILFRRLLRYSRPIPAAILSSVAFGMLHLTVAGAALFGVVMVLLYSRTRSLWVPIAAHMLNNLVATVLLLSTQALEIPEDALSDTRLLIATLPLGLVWTVWFVRRSLGPLHEFAVVAKKWTPRPTGFD